MILIADEAFANCSRLTHITMSDQLSDIAMGAFFNCGGLAEVAIPYSVSDVGHKLSAAHGITVEITGTANIPIVLESSTNLVQDVWVALETCTLTNGLVSSSTAGGTIRAACFYRVQSP